MNSNNLNIKFGTFAGFCPIATIKLSNGVYIGRDGRYKRFTDLNEEEIKDINRRLYSNDENSLDK